MKKKIKGNKNNKKAMPLEVMLAGPVRFERYSDHLIMQSNWSEHQHSQFLSAQAARLPEIIAEIDLLISQASNLVAELPPELLMQHAWQAMFIKTQHAKVEVDLTAEDVLAIRAVLYIQSLIAASPRSAVQKQEIIENDWKLLSEKVSRIYTLVSSEYQISATSKRRIDDPNLDMQYEEFLFRAQVHWCNVSGDGYQAHQLSLLRDLLHPQSALIEAAYGITSVELTDEISKISDSLIFGMNHSKEALLEIHRKVMDAVSAQVEKDGFEDGVSPGELINKMVDKLGLRESFSDAINKSMGTGLFDLGAVTKLPLKFLKDFSWCPGEDTEFLAKGEYSGWPLRILPSSKRPFLKIGEKFFCFDLNNLLDNLYRQIEKQIFRNFEADKQKWIAARKDVSEHLPIEYFSKLLPGCSVYPEAYYQALDKQSGKKKWCEVDCIIEYDDHLFIVEVKAGAFTYTSPADDFPAYISSLKALLQSPTLQGQRFLDYLNGAPEVELFDVKKQIVKKISKSQYRVVTICAVTLDTFTELSAQAQHLSEVGVHLNGSITWPLSLNDLLVYRDLFRTPLEFLHYVEQRNKASTCKALRLDDELDHLGLYLEFNDYSLHAENVSTPKQRMMFQGYRQKFDEFFNAVLLGQELPVFPVQKMPEFWTQCLSFLNASSGHGRACVSSFLLGLSGDTRAVVSQWVESELDAISARGRCLPMSTYGELKLTIFVSIVGDCEISDELAIIHCKVVLASADEDRRELIHLVFSPKRELTDIRYFIVSAGDIKQEELGSFKSKGLELRKQRVSIFLGKHGRPNRNDICPCGSAEKFKKCCGA
ncbi:SEC-C metal-binding domain-containing protein [Pseudomonas syringae]|uniref:SEC-C metal-binding domain-containing protein n=1 Tax=Pseudomonas syringae TaxID=317 RepID=UPI001BCAD7D0|nr:SEC-C metal-binding domain-containing protein [Pseudomonas syringae]QVI70320.1 SEC-C domain-containing protein [Pseudomonas syringae]